MMLTIVTAATGAAPLGQVRLLRLKTDPQGMLDGRGWSRKKYGYHVVW